MKASGNPARLGCSLSCKFQMHKRKATHLIFTISQCFTSVRLLVLFPLEHMLPDSPARAPVCVSVCEHFRFRCNVTMAAELQQQQQLTSLPPSPPGRFVSLYAQLHTARKNKAAGYWCSWVSQVKIGPYTYICMYVHTCVCKLPPITVGNKFCAIERESSPSWSSLQARF